MKIIVTIAYRNGNTTVKQFSTVEDALKLVNETLRRWADNVTSVAVNIELLDDTLSSGLDSEDCLP